MIHIKIPLELEIHSITFSTLKIPPEIMSSLSNKSSRKKRQYKEINEFIENHKL